MNPPSVQIIDEVADVIVVLSGGKPQPIRVRWRNTVYHVSKILNYYFTKAPHLHIFALQTKEDASLEISISGMILPTGLEESLR